MCVCLLLLLLLLLLLDFGLFELMRLVLDFQSCALCHLLHTQC